MCEVTIVGPGVLLPPLTWSDGFLGREGRWCSGDQERYSRHIALPGSVTPTTVEWDSDRGGVAHSAAYPLRRKTITALVGKVNDHPETQRPEMDLFHLCTLPISPILLFWEGSFG